MLQEMIRLYVEEGLTLKEVGDRFGISKQAVHDRLRRAGVKRRKRAQQPGKSLRIVRTKLNIPELVRQYVEEKKSVMELARVFGVNYDMMKVLLVAEGVEIRPVSSYTVRKYPQIYVLKPGESVTIEFPPIVSVYATVGTIARRMKARLSAHRLGKFEYKITRLS